MTDDATGSTDIGATLTLDDCPEEALTADAGTSFTWTNPTGEISITSIVIAATGETVNDNIPTLDVDSTSASLPEGSYTITITAASNEDASVTADCSFGVMVGPAVFTANCPTEAVPIVLNIAGTAITLADDPNVMVSTENVSGTVTFSYDPETITTDDIGTSSVMVTATDTVEGVEDVTSTCTFMVAVTQNVGSTTYTDTTISCASASPASATLDADGTAIDLNTLSISNITATNGSTEITSPTFAYKPDMLTTADDHTITVTVLDSTDAVALSGGTEAECEFTFTVNPAPDASFSTCPSTNSDSITGVVNEEITWDMPVLMGAPTGATISGPTIDPTGATETSLTGATFPDADTYTVTYTAMHNGAAITVGDDSNPLTCEFMVTVTSIQLPMGQLFFLDSDLNSVSSNDPGTSTNPFLIQNTNDLSNLAAAVNDDSNAMIDSMNVSYRTAAYRLENDISFPETTAGMDSNFTPIGTGKAETISQQLVTTCDNKCFEGTFDGASNTISGLYFNNTDRTNLGLFPVISGMNTSISNLILTDVEITGDNNVGGLVGAMISSSSVSNVSVTGSISGKSTTGGLVGQMQSMSDMTNVSASVTVAASNANGGGLVGQMNNSSITNAFASGAVTGNQALGGLVGSMQSSSSVTNAYASGAVGTASTGSLRGGLVGQLNDGTSLTNTLAWGTVTGISALGGLVGQVLGTPTITNSYWQTNNGMPAKGCGTGTCPSDGAQDMMALQMPDSATGIYTNWNNEATDPDAPGAGAVWNFGTAEDYPVFAVTEGSVFPTVACQRDSAAAGC